MVKIDSAYLNADQEAAVSDILTLAKGYGFNVSFGKIFVPEKLKTIRVVLEAKVARDYLATVYKWMAFDSNSAKRSFREIIGLFDKVLKDETKQIRTGEQEFVAEKDEADQV